MTQIFDSGTSKEVRWDSRSEAHYPREGITMIDGQGVLVEGTIVGGPLTSDAGADEGKFRKYDPTGTDGRENAYGILDQRIDTTDADVRCTCYVGGTFRLSELGAEFDQNAEVALAGSLNARGHGGLSLTTKKGGT